jgi:hypothetical protein
MPIEVYKKESRFLNSIYEGEWTELTEYLIIVLNKDKGVYYKPGYDYELKIVDNPHELLKGYKKLNPKESEKIIVELELLLHRARNRNYRKIEEAIESLEHLHEIERTLFIDTENVIKSSS